MNIFDLIREKLISSIKVEIKNGELDSNVSFKNISVEPPKDRTFGDISTNAAMIIGNQSKTKPLFIANNLIKHLIKEDEIDSANVAGPGFINIVVNKKLWHKVMQVVISNGKVFGSNDIGKGQLVNVEYVSANPTGPLHVGHARGAVYGDALANLLKKSGYEVIKEYYINDSGAQVYSLGKAVYFRYLEKLGVKDSNAVLKSIELGEIEYGGDYVKDIAQSLVKEFNDKWKHSSDDEWLEPITQFSIIKMLQLIKEDLGLLGITHDIFVSERKIVNDNKVNLAVKKLKKLNLLYDGVLTPPKGKTIDDWEPRQQLLFKSSDYGDDIDRPIQKSDGSWTYFATDLAYHQDKMSRGFSEMINVWGADHSGYVKRIKSAVKALSSKKANLDVKLCQLVKLFDNGKPVKMSKRSGTFITLRELVEAVGKDVVRFIMLTRKNDVSLDFDFSKVLEKSRENPVFYVQYAYARINSVFRHANEEISSELLLDNNLLNADFSLCTMDEEINIMKLISSWPRIIELSTISHEPHRVVFYLNDLASAFHALWNKGNENAELKFLIKNDIEKSLSRLALIKCVAIVISSGLEVLDVVPLKEMR